MKKLILLVVLFVLIDASAQNDFRKLNWGDSVETLKSNYPDVKWESMKEGEMVFYAYEDMIGGLDTGVFFGFIGEELKAGGYFFTEEHGADNLYYEDYQKISSLLNKKYKMEREEDWNDDTWKGNLNYIGYAILSGDVKFIEFHQGEKTEINHSISGEGNGEIHHTLMYRDIKYFHSLNESALDDF